MVHRLKEQMEALNVVDIPGSDVDRYVTTLAAALKSRRALALAVTNEASRYRSHVNFGSECAGLV